MSENKQKSNLLTRVAVAAFVGVTALLLLPGYFKTWSAATPEDAEYYVKYAFETRMRIFHPDGSFGRIDADVTYGAVTSFLCETSASARREFGWRGAREVVFDCPSSFEDAAGEPYAMVFRLVPVTDPADLGSPEGYRMVHIDAVEAADMLIDHGLMP